MTALKPAKEQYRVVTEIDAPIAQCFAAGTAEDAMMYWVPNIASVVYDNSKAVTPYGEGSERLVKMKNGMSMVEKVHISQEPTFLAYHIPDFGAVGNLLIKNYQGHMTFEALSINKTRLTWIGHFNASGVGRLTEPLTRTMMKKMITTFSGRMKEYLEQRQRA